VRNIWKLFSFNKLPTKTVPFAAQVVGSSEPEPAEPEARTVTSRCAILFAPVAVVVAACHVPISLVVASATRRRTGGRLIGLAGAAPARALGRDRLCELAAGTRATQLTLAGGSRFRWVLFAAALGFAVAVLVVAAIEQLVVVVVAC
jgi:hypothetical protein